MIAQTTAKATRLNVKPTAALRRGFTLEGGPLLQVMVMPL